MNGVQLDAVTFPVPTGLSCSENHKSKGVGSPSKSQEANGSVRGVAKSHRRVEFDTDSDVQYSSMLLP